jgi:hypothetical protein
MMAELVKADALKPGKKYLIDFADCCVSGKLVGRFKKRITAAPYHAPA